MCQLFLIKKITHSQFKLQLSRFANCSLNFEFIDLLPLFKLNWPTRPVKGERRLFYDHIETVGRTNT